MDIGYRVEKWQQTDRMPMATGAMAFTDCCKQMECLGGMLLQSFLTNGHFIDPCNAGYPS